MLRAYALIGGFAVSIREVPRATQDVDFAVAIGSADLYAPAASLDDRDEDAGPDDPLSGALHASIEAGSEPIPLQLVFLSSAFTEVIFRHVETLSVMDRLLPVVSLHVLVLLKLYAGVPQDILDAQLILRV